MVEYLKRLRGDEEIRLGIGVALINDEKEILLELRTDVNMWGLTGGKLEIGEEPKKAGCREVFEETGCIIQEKQLKIFNVYGDPLDGRIVVYPERRIHLIDIIFVTTIHKKEKEMVLSEESQELRYMRAKDIANMQLVPPAQRPLFELIQEGYIE